MNIADDLSDRRHALVALCCKSGAVFLGIHAHAAELVDHKRLLIPGQALLLVEHRTSVVQLDRQCND